MLVARESRGVFVNEEKRDLDSGCGRGPVRWPGMGAVRSGGAGWEGVEVRKAGFPGTMIVGSGRAGSFGTESDGLVTRRDGGGKEINWPRTPRSDERHKSSE